ncbi:PI-PLC domain-containing protein [Streptomyces fulvoviolaceus]|uniref:hypothetical protein n=1 Tax=Streptomyces fulvoviolaceus TaxID=285535 RepID=UPI0021BEDA66|nr:hypothetical protein [Streptomyces fulvoviolaceus]MCT9080104.1 hypothetical protein [Streptomyces fulvoviolaceus]
MGGAAGNAHAASATFAETTAIGTHNAYEKDKYTYFAQALDSGASLLELDVYTDSVSKRWRVSHSNPLANDNNCEYADIAAWHQLHSDHSPIIFKVEMKNGFDNDAGLGPDEFDTLVSQKLGSSVYKPSNLLGSSYSTLDAAAKTDAWPTRGAPQGQVRPRADPRDGRGVEPPRHLLDRRGVRRPPARPVHGRHHLLRAGLPGGAGRGVGRPAREPLLRRHDPAWFVFFDGDAATYVNNAYDTSFYSTNHYILIMTDACGASPAISSTDPTDAEVDARLSLLAADHASVITSDWSAKSATVLGSVTTRN